MASIADSLTLGQNENYGVIQDEKQDISPRKGEDHGISRKNEF